MSFMSDWSAKNSRRDYAESTGRDTITKITDGRVGDVTRGGLGLGALGGVVGGAAVGGVEIAKSGGRLWCEGYCRSLWRPIE